jgi:LCP family protein required for cell wall assembly
MGGKRGVRPDAPEFASGGGDGASVEGGRHRGRPGPRDRLITALVAAAGLVVALVGVAIGGAAWTVNDYGSQVGRLPDVFPPGERPPSAPGSLTFLVVGVDPSEDAASGAVAESLVLVRVTGDRKGVQMVFLPPDLHEGTADGAGSTLRDAFDTGGPQRLVGAVESLTGVRINHVGLLDFAGFETMTDALGGVTVDVPEPYRNGDRYFPAGRQQLDGTAALAYMRNSGGSEARSGSALRQQRMIRALSDRVAEQGALSDLGRLTGTLESLTRSLKVDETLENSDLVSLAWDLRGVRTPQFVTAPTDARAGSLWAYLRTDSLRDHLDEFR